MARTNHTGDVTRLPVWAQKEIQELLHKVNRLEAEVVERDEYIHSQHEGTNVFIGRGINQERPLPKNADLNFRFSDRWDNSISVRHDSHYPRTVYVTSLDGQLVVSPASGNAIYVGIRERN